MEKIFSDSWLSGAVPDALFRTLLHSLWLGLVMAALSGLIILCTKKAGPHTRYKLLVSVLGLFVFSTVFIFIYAYQNISNNSVILISQTMLSVPDSGNTIISLSNSPTWLEISKSFLIKYSSWFVLGWLVIISLKTIQLLMGITMLGRLRKHHTIDAGKLWNERLERLMVSMNMSAPVKLCKSATASVPMVIGFFKPLILFPAAMLNALKTDEVEAIILHELAHIRRHDFLVNLLQRFTEIIFFFNPAVHWISELIRREREYCCDDLAIAVINDKKQYVHALVAFQEFQLQQPELKYATAFPGYKNEVLNRISRIINNNNKTLNSMEKIILGSVIVTMAVATLAFSQQKKQQAPHQQNFKKQEQIVSSKDDKNVSESRQEIKDTIIFEGPVTEVEENAEEMELLEMPLFEENRINDTNPGNISVTHSLIAEYKVRYQGKTYEFLKKGNKILTLKIDGREIKASEFPKHQPALKEIDKMIAKSYQEQQLQLAKLAVDQAKLAESLARSNDMQALLQSKQFALAEKEFLLHQQFNPLNPIIAEDLNAANQIALDKMRMEYELKNNLFQKQQELSKSLELSRMKVHEDMALQNQAQLELLQKIEIERQDEIGDVINDLYEEGIIKDKHNFKMKLNNKELIINGKKQSEETHEKVLKRFQKKAGDKVDFEYNLTN
ncbi:M56 family metallopeptidase [Pollutibacter soli]|uniref:M56 family metallopeptidase n=1 Tax=Pollutibacter soli TaxID=3034157 RepID=UPI003013B081